jgi:hypothetical protein
MGNAQVTFRYCMQDTQDIGNSDEHMVSRVFFSLKYDRKVHEDLYVDIKQAVGADFETSPLEVGVPQGYRGPFNHESFREEVEKYYRDLIGSKGAGIRITGSGNVRMRNNRFDFPRTVDFEIHAGKGGW